MSMLEVIALVLFKLFLLLTPCTIHNMKGSLGAVELSLSLSWLSPSPCIGYLSVLHRVFAAVIFTALSIGRASSYAPDAQKAKVAASRIFQLIQREPDIDGYSTEGEKPVSE